MSLVKSITSNNWQLSPSGFGNIDEGIQDINTCIATIIMTPVGSDVARPFFGTNAYKYIDQPVTKSIPNLMKEIKDGIDLWEKRIKLLSVEFLPNNDGSGGEFKLRWQLVDSDLINLFILKYPY